VVLLQRSVSARRRALWLAASVGTAVLVISPWTIYNQTRFDHPVILSTNLGGAMTQANCDPVYSGTLLGYHDNTCLANAHVNIAGVDESTRDLRLRRHAVRYIRTHLTRLPVVIAARLGRAWGVYRPFETARLEADWSRTRLWVHQSAVVSYWILLVLAMFGAVVLRHKRVALYPLVAFMVTVVVAVALILGEARYRAAADVPIVMLAAVAIDTLFARRSPTRAAAEDDDSDRALPM
jgi:hypothetical protein